MKIRRKLFFAQVKNKSFEGMNPTLFYTLIALAVLVGLSVVVGIVLVLVPNSSECNTYTMKANGSHEMILEPLDGPLEIGTKLQLCDSDKCRYKVLDVIENTEYMTDSNGNMKLGAITNDGKDYTYNRNDWLDGGSASQCGSAILGSETLDDVTDTVTADLVVTS